MFCKQRKPDFVVQSPDSTVPPYGAAVLRGPSTRKPAWVKPPPVEWFPTQVSTVAPSLVTAAQTPAPGQQSSAPTRSWQKSFEESKLGYAEEGQALSGVAGTERDTQSEQRKQAHGDSEGAFYHCHQSYSHMAATLTQLPQRKAQ